MNIVMTNDNDAIQLRKTTSFPLITFHSHKYTMLESPDPSCLQRGGRARLCLDKAVTVHTTIPTILFVLLIRMNSSHAIRAMYE